MDADIRSSQPQAVQATRRFSLALLLAVAFAFAAAGCAGSPVYLLTGSDPNRPPVPSRQPTPITTVTSNLPTVGCYTNFALGLLSVDPQYGTRIADGTIGGGSGPVMWPVGYTARKSGSEVEVLDGNGHVVAVTGRRYHLGGAFVGRNPDSWLACGEVLPQ